MLNAWIVDLLRILMYSFRQYEFERIFGAGRLTTQALCVMGHMVLDNRLGFKTSAQLTAS